MLITTSAWDTLASRFNPEGTAIHPDIADNVLMAWPALLKQVEPYISYDSSSQVLDFGCGTGGLSISLAERGVSVTALDPSAGMIATAKKIGGTDKVDFVVGDYMVLPLVPTYSAVVSCMVFQFIKNIDEVASALFKSMNSNSILSFTSFGIPYIECNSGDLTKVFGGEGKAAFIRFDTTPVPIYIRDAEEYASIFEKAGFEYQGASFIPFSERFLKEYWSPASGVDVSEPKYLLSNFVKR